MSTGTEIDAPALIDRFTLKALVESCLVVEEGVASMKDVDLGMMAGAGIIPPPFARADQLGLDEVLAKLEAAGMPMNMVQTVGHTQVRRLVLGDVDRQASPAELERMKSLVREAMQAGAIGLSTALIYPPAVYASTDSSLTARRPSSLKPRGRADRSPAPGAERPHRSRARRP